MVAITLYTVVACVALGVPDMTPVPVLKPRPAEREGEIENEVAPFVHEGVVEAEFTPTLSTTLEEVG